jgi:hypothetical protein
MQPSQCAAATVKGYAGLRYTHIQPSNLKLAETKRSGEEASFVLRIFGLDHEYAGQRTFREYQRQIHLTVSSKLRFYLS